MKCVLLFFCLLLVNCGIASLLGNGRPGGFLRNRLGSGCVQETNATQADIAEIKDQQIPTRREGKCLLTCIMNRLGITLEEARSRLEDIGLKILQHLQENNPALYQKVLPVLITCGLQVQSANLADACDFAQEIISCGVRQGLTTSSSGSADDTNMFDLFNF